jgi:hypothetical protein
MTELPLRPASLTGLPWPPRAGTWPGPYRPREDEPDPEPAAVPEKVPSWRGSGKYFGEEILVPTFSFTANPW